MAVKPLKHLQKLFRRTPWLPQPRQPANRHDTVQHSLLLELPTEIIFNVVSQLERRDAIMLSLTCKCLHMIISSDHNIDVSLRHESSEVKAQVLRLFEHNWPSHLVCRRCGCLFNWRQRDPSCILCPDFLQHTEIENSRHDTFAYIDEKLYVSREVIDLILRARRRGISHGVPPSVLDANREGWYGVHRKTKARFVKENLLFLCHSQVKVQDMKEEVERLGVLERSLCLHLKTRLRKIIWQAVWQFASNTGSSEKLELPLKKCNYCETDAKLFVRHLSEGKLMVEMKVWRNFGNGDEGVQIAEQMFQSNADALTEIDTNFLSLRHLQADFEGR